MLYNNVIRKMFSDLSYMTVPLFHVCTDSVIQNFRLMLLHFLITLIFSEKNFVCNKSEQIFGFNTIVQRYFSL